MADPPVSYVGNIDRPNWAQDQGRRAHSSPQSGSVQRNRKARPQIQLHTVVAAAADGDDGCYYSGGDKRRPGGEEHHPAADAPVQAAAWQRGVTDDISEKLILAAYGRRRRNFVFSTQTQAAVGHPIHVQAENGGSGSSYRPYSISSSRSGTIVSSNYDTSVMSSSVSMSTEVLGLDFDRGDEDDVGFIQSINKSRQERRKERMKQMVQEFFAAPSANNCIDGDMSVLERWFEDLGVGWVVHVADGASAGELDRPSHARSWILALNEIVETINLTWPIFPDHDTLGLLPGEEEEEEEEPELYQSALFVQKTMSTMLSFVDAIVASTSKTTIGIGKVLTDSGLVVLLPYEKTIVTLLRVRAALSSATLQLTFYYSPSEEFERILDEIASLLSAKEDKTDEAIWSTMEQIRMQLTAGVTAWSSSLAPQGRPSDVHKATRYVMGYIRFLLSHRSSMEPIVTQAASLDRYVPRTRRRSLLLISLIMEMVSSVQQGLAKNSESFPDQSLRFLFLINNSNFITQELRYTLPSLSDHDEAAAVADKVEGYMESYMQVSWAPLLSCLHKPTPRLGRNYHPLSKFESEFHKIYTTQKLWKVPDPKLRKRLRSAITEKIIPDYTKYIEDNNVSAPKFTPQQLEEMLQELFEG